MFKSFLENKLNSKREEWKSWQNTKSEQKINGLVRAKLLRRRSPASKFLSF